MRLLPFLFFFLYFAVVSFKPNPPQADFATCLVDTSQTHITVSGKAFDAEHPAQRLIDLMIVNLRTQQGFFGKADGSFITSIEKKDTILVASTGFASQKFCFADSSLKENYFISISLKKLSVQLKEVQIFSPRDLDAIQKDISKLGYNKHDYELSGVDAFSSPITFLYQEFSRRERLKRHNAVLVNDDKRRNLLKELLQRYVADDIIQLSNDAFEAFIDYAQVSEEFMKSSTQYEFIVFIKDRYKMFGAVNDYYREK